MSSPIPPFKPLTPPFTSDRLERISAQLRQAIAAAITVPHREDCDESLLPDILYSLTMWRSRPMFFTEMAYEWCSVICERYQHLGFDDDKNRALLFRALEIGFRHLDPQSQIMGAKLTHTEHHREMADVVFKHGGDEVIADLLHAWTPVQTCRYYYILATPLHTCVGYLVGLQRLQPFSPRLRPLLILSIRLIDYRRFEEAGSERFFELLDHLHIDVEDMDIHVNDIYFRCGWVKFLLNVVKSAEAIRRLSYPYWELLVELAISDGFSAKLGGYSPYAHIIESLEGAKEWDKLECWICVVWVLWNPGSSDARATNLESATLSLFRRRPGAIQKLDGWMEKVGWWRLESYQARCGRGSLDVAGQHTP